MSEDFPRPMGVRILRQSAAASDEIVELKIESRVEARLRPMRRHFAAAQVMMFCAGLFCALLILTPWLDVSTNEKIVVALVSWGFWFAAALLAKRAARDAGVVR